MWSLLYQPLTQYNQQSLSSCTRATFGLPNVLVRCQPGFGLQMALYDLDFSNIPSISSQFTIFPDRYDGAQKNFWKLSKEIFLKISRNNQKKIIKKKRKKKKKNRLCLSGVLSGTEIDFRISISTGEFFQAFTWQMLVGLISLFNGISTFVGHLMPNLFS